MIEQAENSTDKHQAASTEINDSNHRVSERVWVCRDIFVNFYFIQDRESGNWVLIDTGLATSKNKILKLADELFPGTPPSAIVLTHGHFDHIGSVHALLEHWNVPVYAHYLEFPYLSGKASYPPPDPTVGGGLMSALSPFYKKTPIDISGHLNVLPENGYVPFLTEWRYVHTPGHAPGHISLFREGDRLLVAGDAFVTTQQESFFATITQKQKLCGPPAYFTCDWIAAEQSVKELAALNPTIVASGHGKPWAGTEMENELRNLASNFSSIAVPSAGRYVKEAAIADASGIRYIPSKPKSSHMALLILLGVVTASVAALILIHKRKTED